MCFNYLTTKTFFGGSLKKKNNFIDAFHLLVHFLFDRTFKFWAENSARISGQISIRCIP
jgi:hypothetical protein